MTWNDRVVVLASAMPWFCCLGRICGFERDGRVIVEFRLDEETTQWGFDPQELELAPAVLGVAA